MVESKSHVSIGLPIFNGEKYIRQALDSILAQTYQDFELIISDNASTDHTPEICRAYAAEDSRIHYYRNKRNVGAVKNFNRVFKLSSGTYFKWVAHDDVIAPEFLSRCVSVLDHDPSVVLCYSKTGIINEDSELVGTYGYSKRVDSRKPHERFGDVIHRDDAWTIFGVTRTDALKKTRLFGCYVNSDHNLLAEIALIGRILEIPEILYFRRRHAKSYTTRYYESGRITLRNYAAQLAWWKGDEKRAGQIILPHWRKCLEFWISARRAPLKWSERLLCYEQICRWLTAKGWRLMKWDLAVALSYLRLSLR